MISIKKQVGAWLMVILAFAALTGCQSPGEKLYEQAKQLKSSAEGMAASEAQTEKFKEAIDLLQQAIELEPRNAKCYYKLGQCYKKINEFDQAVVALKKSLELDDGNWRTYDQLLSVRIKMGRLDEAEQLLQDMKAMSIFQKDVRARETLPERQEELLAAQRGR